MLAVLYDIHGNLLALEAVLADAERAGAARFVLGGDYALFGAWPAESVERLRALDAEWIRGNGERWTGALEEAPGPVRPAVERCRELLGSELVAELAALPFETTRAGARFCHASPVSDMDGFLPEPGPDEPRLLEGVEEARLLVGHTHMQFRREAEGVEVVNPGSVGMPFDGDPRAAYALLGSGGELELRRVEYDHHAAAAATREALGEAGELPARRIEQARVDA